MMNILKKSTLGFMTLLLVTATTNPMGQSLHKTCKAVNIAIPLLPIAFGAGVGIYKSLYPADENKTLLDAPPIIKQFVHENLQTIGVNKPDLAIKMHAEDFAAGPGTIAIPNREVDTDNPDSLINLLKKRQASSSGLMATLQETEKLNLYKSIIQHEGTHLKNNDSRKRGIAASMIFCAANYSLLYTFLHKDAAIKATPSIMRSLALIPSGFAKLIMAAIAANAYSRYVEQKADDGISDNIEILQAAANKYRKAAQEDKQSEIAQQQWFPKHPVRRKIENFLSELGEDHPSDTQRAERFEQRIAQLKEKDNQNN